MAKRKKKDEDEQEFDMPEERTELALRDPTGLMFLEDDEEPAVVLALVPPDLERCQCEWPDQEIVTFGPRPRVRCDQPATCVAFQKRAQDDDTPTGAMSLCDDHRLLIEHAHPGQCYYRVITHDKKIGGVV